MEDVSQSYYLFDPNYHVTMLLISLSLALLIGCFAFNDTSIPLMLFMTFCFYCLAVIVAVVNYYPVIRDSLALPFVIMVYGLIIYAYVKITG